MRSTRISATNLIVIKELLREIVEKHKNELIYKFKREYDNVISLNITSKDIFIVRNDTQPNISINFVDCCSPFCNEEIELEVADPEFEIKFKNILGLK